MSCASSGTERARRRRPLAAAAALAGAISCNGSGEVAPAAAAVREPGSVRLIDALDRAVIRTEPESWARGEFDEDVALQQQLDESFDERSWPGPWIAGSVLETALEDPQLAASQPRAGRGPESLDGASVRRLDAGESLVAMIPAPSDLHWLVTARMRGGDRASAGGAGISFVPLLHEARTPEEVIATARERAAAFRARPRPRLLEGGGEWRTLELIAGPYPGRRSLAISLFGGDGGAWIDAVEVRALTQFEALMRAPAEAVETPRHPLHRAVSAGGETWDSLVLPVPASIEWSVDVPRVAPRLELALRFLRESGLVPLGFDVLVDGVPVDRAGFDPRAADAFGARTIDLAPHAGRRVRLSFKTRGPKGSAVAIGAPSLLGGREPAGDPRRNLVLISLDTLRADAVGCYGASGVETPRIDALAAGGVRFARVLSPASYTLPTHLSMLSGQDPLVHQTVRSTQPMDPARTITLAQRFRAAGFRTAAFTGGGMVHPRYGFSSGFDSYSIRDPSGVASLHRRIGNEAAEDAAPGEDRMRPVADWLGRNADQPFFLFVHTYLVHNYRPGAADLERRGSGPRPAPAEVGELRRAASGGDRAAAARLLELYRTSAEQADREIVGRLLDELARLGLDSRTVVALVSDHGEGFLEHGMIGHSTELWGELTTVPWIVRGPGVPRGVVRDDPVGLADVAPTLAALLSLPPDPRVLARDQLLVDPADNFAEPRLLTLRDIAGQPDQDALVLWPWKLLRRDASDPAAPLHLFQVEEDPAESRDLAASEPERAAGMLRLLDRLLREQRELVSRLPSTAGDRRFDMPPELERMLDGLGYGAGGGR